MEIFMRLDKSIFYISIKIQINIWSYCPFVSKSCPVFWKGSISSECFLLKFLYLPWDNICTEILTVASVDIYHDKSRVWDTLRWGCVDWAEKTKTWILTKQLRCLNSVDWHVTGQELGWRFMSSGALVPNTYRDDQKSDYRSPVSDSST